MLEWKSCVQLDDDIKSLLEKQADRGFCNFTFKNNLEDNLKIDYIKITHLFEGRDAFIYEYSNIANGEELMIKPYAIGVTPDTSENTGKLKVGLSTEVDVDNDDKLDKDNVYDRLYIHFVITVVDEIGGKKEQKLFHHSYEQVLNNQLRDLITLDGKLTASVLELINIYLYFDPRCAKYIIGEPDDMFKLILQVVVPRLDEGDKINVQRAILRS